jgi:hypothetical protein
MTMASDVRRVPVIPLSARAELATILRLGVGIAVTATSYVFVGASLWARNAGDETLLPFQVMVQSRPETEQRTFRELREALLEAEVRFSTTGVWPSVEELAAEGIPPFAFDPTSDTGSYVWRLIEEGEVVNYLGVPSEPDSPAWLLVIREPLPGAPPDPALEDESHHRLITGVTLRVSTWVRDDGRVEARLISAPQAEGWTELFGVGPAAP